MVLVAVVTLLGGMGSSVQALGPEVADDIGGGGPGAAVIPASAGKLEGLFRLIPADCDGNTVSGSYFRMIQPGGNTDGPYIENNSSTCADHTYTDLQPGTDGGLSTVAYQPHPDPAFDAGGNGTNGRITKPKEFFGRKFATATNPADPQTSAAAPVPAVTHDGAGNLSGNLAAFAAAYGGQHFNQGAPKPDGSTPGLTSGPTGTYDAATGRFTLQWASTIVGGPFNRFTGRWHFEGTFEPAAGATTAAGRTAAGPAKETRIRDEAGPWWLAIPSLAAQRLEVAGLAIPELVVPRSAAPGLATPGLRVPGLSAPELATPVPDAPLATLRTGAVAPGGLNGLFRVTAADCAGATTSGSHFRMAQPGGDGTDGPFLANTSSTCSDQTYTDLQPGTDGGISTVAFQPHPDPAFTGSGGVQEGANDRITQPKEFFGSKFSTATNPTDPQTGLATAIPTITADASGGLTGDMRAFAAAYQGQHFNQGAPKPDGSTPGATSPLTGTYDTASGKFTIEWASTIVGGPFDNFTGKWHFEGTFEPATPAPPAEGPGSTGDSTTPDGDSPNPGAPTVVTPPTVATPPASGATPPASGANSPASGTTAGTGEVATSGTTPRTGPPWPSAVPAALIALAGVGRRLSRRGVQRDAQP